RLSAGVLKYLSLGPGYKLTNKLQSTSEVSAMLYGLFSTTLVVFMMASFSFTQNTHSRSTSSSNSGKRSVHKCAPSSNTAGETDQPGCGTHCGNERWRVKLSVTMIRIRSAPLPSQPRLKI